MKNIFIILALVFCSFQVRGQIFLSEIQDASGNGYVPITDYDSDLATYIQKYVLLQDYLTDEIDWNITSLDLNQVLTNGNDAGGLDAINFAEVEADEFIGDLRGAVLFKAQAGEALAKGDVVYVSGISGNTTIVSKADADDANKMPAFGVVAAAASLNNPVDIYTFGTLSNLNTSAYTIGDILYVSTTAGQLTATPPTGESALLQNIAKVTRVHASSGSIKISGAGRTNATPNLNTGRLFVGNASNQAVADGTMYVDIANSRVGIGTTNPLDKLHVNGAIRVENSNTLLRRYLSGWVEPLHDVVYSGFTTAGDNYNDYVYLKAPSSGGFTHGIIIIGDDAFAIGNTSVETGAITSLDKGYKLFGNSTGIGIGTNSPSAKLDVVGTLEVSDDANFDSNTLFVDASTDRVGIGTSSPSQKLEVAGNIFTTNDGVSNYFRSYHSDGNYTNYKGYGIELSRSASYIRPTSSGTKDLIIGGSTLQWDEIDLFYDNNVSFYYNGNLLMNLIGDLSLFDTGANEDIRLNPNGDSYIINNLGIGTSPSVRIHAKSSTLGTLINDELTVARFEVSGGNRINLDYSSKRLAAGSNWQNTEQKLSFNIDENASKDVWIKSINATSTSDNVLAFGEGASEEWMRIDNGDTGFGETSPNRTVEITNTGSAYEAALEINSNSDLANWARLDLTNVNATGGFIFYQDNGGKAGIRNLSTDRITYTIDDASGLHAWNIGSSTEVMRLNATGLGIGTVSPAKQVEIENTGADATMIVQTTDDYNAYIEYQNNSGLGGLNYRTGVTTLEHWDISSSGQTMLRVDRATLQNTSFVDFNVTDGSTSMQLNEDGLLTSDGVLNFVNAIGGYTTTYTTGASAAAFSGQTTIAGFDYFLLNGGTLEAAKDQDYFELKYQDHDGATHSSFTWDAEWRFYEDGYFHTDAGIVHLNDEDTFFKFTTNKIQTYAGSSASPKATYNASGITFNEGGVSSNDFRVNGTVSYMIFGDAGLNRVGIFEGSPSAELDVVGDTELNGEVTWSERGLARIYGTGVTNDSDGTFNEVNMPIEYLQQGEITANELTDEITITNTGYYKITVNCWVRNVSNETDVAHVFVTNDTGAGATQIANVPIIKHIGTDQLSYSMSYIVSLTAGDDIALAVVRASGTGSVEIDEPSLEVERLIGY